MSKDIRQLTKGGEQFYPQTHIAGLVGYGENGKAIDEEPTAGSDNLINSRGVFRDSVRTFNFDLSSGNGINLGKFKIGDTIHLKVNDIDGTEIALMTTPTWTQHITPSCQLRNVTEVDYTFENNYENVYLNVYGGTGNVSYYRHSELSESVHNLELITYDDRILETRGGAGNFIDLGAFSIGDTIYIERKGTFDGKYVGLMQTNSWTTVLVPNCVLSPDEKSLIYTFENNYEHVYLGHSSNQETIIPVFYSKFIKEKQESVAPYSINITDVTSNIQRNGNIISVNDIYIFDKNGYFGKPISSLNAVSFSINVNENKMYYLSSTENEYTPFALKLKQGKTVTPYVLSESIEWGHVKNIDYYDWLYLKKSTLGVLAPYINPLLNNDRHFISKWAGKKVGFMGDSITQGGHYVNAYRDLTSCNAINYGIGGTSISGTDSDTFCKRYDTQLANDLDMLVVMGGVNDFRGGLHSQPLGVFEDANLDGSLDDTFYGALHTLMRGLKHKYQSRNIPIVFFTILHNQYEGRTNDGDYNRTLYAENGQIVEMTFPVNGTEEEGQPMRKYNEAIKKCAEFYSIYVVDVCSISGIQPLLPENKAAYTSDGCHLNAGGGEQLAKVIYPILETVG